MSFIDLAKAFIPLVLIVLLLFGVLLFIRKYGFSINGKKTNYLNIKVLNSQLIMPKKYISVVKVKDKLLLLGISENSITLLKEMDDTEPEEMISGEDEKQTFLDILKKNMGMR